MRQFVLVFLVVVLAGSLSAQFGNELNLVGNGARIAGMGYAATGLADDATAISVNPAGIAQLQSMEASVVGRLTTGSIDIAFKGLTGISAEVDQSSSFDLNFASFIVPFSTGKTRVVGGVAYRTIVDAATKLDLTLSDGTDTGTASLETTGGLRSVTPALAVEISPNFSIGAGGNILFGTSQTTFEFEGDKEEDPEESYSGFFFDIGALFKASDQFSIGANLTPPYTLTRKVSIPDGEDYEIETEIPFTSAFGVAFKPVPEFTIVADYRIRPFSKAKLTVVGEQGELEDFWEDINSFHVGAEYLIMSGDLIIPIRGGFYTNPTVSTAYDPDKPDGKGDQITGNVITVGIGLVLDRLLLDASVEFGSYDDYGEEFDLGLGAPLEITLTQSFTRINLGAVLHLGK